MFTPIQLNKDSTYYKSGGDGDEGYYYSIPWDFLNMFQRISHKYNYVLAFDIANEQQKVELEFVYGGATPEDAIYNGQLQQNEQMQQQNEALNNMSNAIDNQTQAIDNMTNTITDDTVTSTASDLPSINVNDITQDGVNNIFQVIYNAFCVGSPQNIVLPIPKTNKSITINPYFLRNILQNQNLSWIYNFIQIIWGYFIGRYIVLDVAKKLNKIKSGNITEVENSNIKEDML